MLEIEVVSRRQRRHQETRREILDAAWQVATETGIGGLSLREVARRVGMRAPSLYTYFDSKHALFDAMFVDGYTELEEAAAGWSETVRGLEPEPALTTALTEWIRFCQASLPRYQIMFTRAVPGWYPSAEAYAVSQRQYAAMAEELNRLGIRGQPALDLFTAMASGLVAQQLANDGVGSRWTDLAPDVARMLLTHLKGGET